MTKTIKLSEKARRVLAVVNHSTGWTPYARDSETTKAVAELCNAGIIETNNLCQMRAKQKDNVVAISG